MTQPKDNTSKLTDEQKQVLRAIRDCDLPWLSSYTGIKAPLTPKRIRARISEMFITAITEAKRKKELASKLAKMRGKS